MNNIVETQNGAKLIVKNFVNPIHFTKNEKQIWESRELIFKAIGGRPSEVADIKVAETISYTDNDTFTEGCYNLATHEIIMSRPSLHNQVTFFGTLLHEIAHARSKAVDGSLEFEEELSTLLGCVSSSLIQSVNGDIDLIKPSINIDSVATAYVSCRCVLCQSTDFDYPEDLSWVKCNKCGHLYEGGYNELVNLNRHYMEEYGDDVYANEAIMRAVNSDNKQFNIQDMNISEHLNFFGVPINGTADEMLEALASANLMKPEHELSKLVRQQNQSDIVTIFDVKLGDLECGLGFLCLSHIGQAKRIMLPFPNLMGSMAVDLLAAKLIPTYGKPFKPTGQMAQWKFDCGKIVVLDTQNSEHGVVVFFNDKANSDDPDDNV